MADSSAGAPSHDSDAWHPMDWKQVHETVRRLQARLVQATQGGTWHTVHALHSLLTNSCSGKALAVRRVTANQGKHTPGVDGERWNDPPKKRAALQRWQRHGYHPLPLRRVSILKSNGTMRPLGIPTMQALDLQALDPIAASLADPNSYGFRKERRCAAPREQCGKSLCQQQSATWILDGDIQSCFDTISHTGLLTHIPTDKVIL